MSFVSDVPMDGLTTDQLFESVASPLPHPDIDAMRSMAQESIDWVVNHFESLPRQPIGNTASRAQLERLLREAPPEHGKSFHGVLEEFRSKVFPNAMSCIHPRFLAFIPGAPTFPAMLGDLLCLGTNFFAGVWLEASGPAEVELVVLDWFKEFLGMPATAGGIITSGGSEANLTALVAARNAIPPADWSRLILYLGEQRHWSMDRAAHIMGIPKHHIKLIGCDAQYRIKPNLLADAIAHDRRHERIPWAAVANAGATNTGAVDPLEELSAVCRKHNVWLHVDGAYGWTAVLHPTEGKLLAGIGQADSITLDPHKWFAQPFEAGCILVRDRQQLQNAFRIRPDYLQDVEATGEEVNFADHGISLTRRFRALKIWVSMKVFGVGWYRQLVDHCCRLAEFAQHKLVESPDFEILSPRQLSIVCFRFVPPIGTWAPPDIDSLNLRILERVRQSGQAFLSSTRLKERVAIRMCFVNWRTTAADVLGIIRLIEEIGEELSAK